MKSKKASRGKTLAQLFGNMLMISSCTFGGGFVIITFMKRIFVDKLHWIDEGEMLDYTALAESCPGAIAVNTAILLGWRMGGFWGMLVSVLGTVLPPMLILSLVSLIYERVASNVWVALAMRGMQAGVAAIILDVVCSLSANTLKHRPVLNALVMVAAFAAVFFFHVNVILILLAAALAGLVHGWRMRGRKLS